MKEEEAVEKEEKEDAEELGNEDDDEVIVLSKKERECVRSVKRIYNVLQTSSSSTEDKCDANDID